MAKTLLSRVYTLSTFVGNGVLSGDVPCSVLAGVLERQEVFKKMLHTCGEFGVSSQGACSLIHGQQEIHLHLVKTQGKGASPPNPALRMNFFDIFWCFSGASSPNSSLRINFIDIFGGFGGKTSKFYSKNDFFLLFFWGKSSKFCSKHELFRYFVCFLGGKSSQFFFENKLYRYLWWFWGQILQILLRE